MSLVIRKKDGQPVHTPKRRDHFEFDDEVSAIFENMAERSIPMYAEVHRLNAAIIQRHKNSTRHAGPYVIWDIGGSTGMAAKALMERLGAYAPQGMAEVAYHVIDVSEPMLAQVHEKLPWVICWRRDLTAEDWMFGLPQPDCVILNYVIQFVKPPYKAGIVKAAVKALRPRGLFFLAQKEVGKENNAGIVPVAMDEEYIQFRRDNGYSQEEIDLKTRALKNSMWLVTKQTTLTMLYEAGFSTVHETTRWCQFASYACTKTKAGQ